MGTYYSVKLEVDGDVDKEQIAAGIKTTLEEINSLMSNWDEGSDVSRFNRHQATDPISVSEHTAIVLQNAIDISARTGGALDPTIGPLIDLWGFGASKSVAFPEDTAIEEALNYVGIQRLQLKGRQLSKTVPNLTLNLSANAKGYAVDRVCQYLREQGFKNFMVEVGGEVRVGSFNRKEPWFIGVNDPGNPMTSLFGVIKLTDHALATSGDYHNYFLKDGVRYSHILDPTTGRPVVSRIASASVVAKDCMTADALATSLIVLDPDQALDVINKMTDVECMLLVKDGDTFREILSSGMKKYIKE